MWLAGKKNIEKFRENLVPKKHRKIYSGKVCWEKNIEKFTPADFLWGGKGFKHFELQHYELQHFEVPTF